MERNLTMIALFAALIAALGLIPKFTLGFGVPITAQSLGVMLCGTVLGAWRGGLAALLFVALVALGLPLLAGGRGGLGVFASPTVGFLVGFPIGAFVTGFIMDQWRNAPVGLAAGVSAVLGGILVVYAFGKYSMAHFNPAVTIAFFITKHVKAQQLPLYFTAQTIGAFLGSIFVLFVIGDYANLGTNAPDISYPLSAVFGYEVIASIFLMGVIYIVVRFKKLRIVTFEMKY